MRTRRQPLRNDEPEAYDAVPQGYGAGTADENEPSDADLWLSDGQAEDAGAADKSATGQDELLLDADRLAAQDEPIQPMLGGGRRRGLVSGDSGAAGGGGGAGSTLFERMANLSRGGSKSVDEDEEDEGDDSGSASLSIPRFLGRQNNQ